MDDSCKLQIYTEPLEDSLKIDKREELSDGNLIKCDQEQQDRKSEENAVPSSEKQVEDGHKDSGPPLNIGERQDQVKVEEVISEALLGLEFPGSKEVNLNQDVSIKSRNRGKLFHVKSQELGRENDQKSEFLSDGEKDGRESYLARSQTLLDADLRGRLLSQNLDEGGNGLRQ